MDIVLRQATIIDPASPYHNQQKDVYILNGIIKAIDTAINQKAQREINANTLLLSPGWVDTFSHFCDPGFEYKETLQSGAATAAAGGFTDVFILPNTSPFVHNKSAVSYIIEGSRPLAVNIHPIGGITKNGEGKELAEMYDMFHNGAVAFSDGLSTVQNEGLLLKALQYVKSIDATIIQLPDNASINPNGLMHEGITSTILGLPGKPAIAEELMIVSGIELAKYTGSKIHFTGVSTAKSIALIAAAKEEGISVSCSVTPYHLYYCDEDLATYDTNLKVNPPLRTQKDRAALQQAVLTGMVDCIAAHHLPQNKDEKLVEFEYAKKGMIGLQTSFAVLNTLFPQLSTEALVALFCTNARQLFKMPMPVIKENEPAVLTLFSRSEEWTFTAANNRSQSANSAFIGKTLKGKALGIINKDSLFLNEEL